MELENVGHLQVSKVKKKFIQGNDTSEWTVGISNRFSLG